MLPECQPGSKTFSVKITVTDLQEQEETFLLPVWRDLTWLAPANRSPF